jgi:amidase/aspartyl-tRNA(Asn)/glutamyl-tRNA(Gln) amidotransferase subunit A
MTDPETRCAFGVRFEMTTLLACDATELAALLRSRAVSAEEAVGQSIDRIERLNLRLNAVVTPLFEEARAEARRRDAAILAGAPLGPLHGVPIVIKDLFDFRAGVRNTFGCRVLADFVPQETAAHIARLEQAGAVIVGKTNTPELGHKGVTDNRLFGATSTPFDLTRNAGGSSGGSAAAVAAGMVPLGQGSDAGGSVRIPAAWCGIVGFKPSFGRIPNTGGPNAFDTHTPFVHVGSLARSVRDAALMTQVMMGPHPRDPLSVADDSLDLGKACRRPIAGMKVAYSPDFGVFAVEREVADLVRVAVTALADAGAIVEEPAFELPCSQDELAALWRRQVGVFYAELFAALRAAGHDLDAPPAGHLPAEVREMVDYGRAARALQTREDQWLRTRIFHTIADVFDRYELLVTPTLTCHPVKNQPDGGTLGPESVVGKPVERTIGWCMTHPVNFTGHPAASAPAGLTASGLPVGIQIIGRRFADGTVLAACRALEERRPWRGALQQCWQALA